ncbi:MAG: glycosyltransferase 4 family protein [archaeon]
MLYYISAAIAAIAVLLIMPPFIRRMHKQDFVGKDMNKYSKPAIAELGGVVVFLGFALGIFSSMFLSTYLQSFSLDFTLLFAGFATIAMIAFVGFIDDIIGWKKGIRQWQHALFPILAALPLMAISAGDTTMTLPFVGLVNLGIIFPLVIIPLGITGASNAFNMLAGFNGLEATQGILITATLTIIALITGNMTAAILGLAMIGALIAFLRFNWFPAKIFGGDSLTLMVGANIAVMSIIGNMEIAGVILISLYFIEFIIKAKHKFQSECFGLPQKSGKLSYNPKGGSLTHLVLRMGKNNLTEPQVTIIISIFQLSICIITLAIFFLKI